MDVESLLGGKTFAVPVTGQHVLPGKQGAKLRVVEVLSLAMPMRHNMQEGFQRWTCFLDAPVVKITSSDAFVGLNHVLHTIHENIVILRLGTKHLVGKNHVRMMKHASKETEHEP